MPLPRQTRFRLLATLPPEVAFKTITYRLAVVQVPVSGQWQLRAEYRGGYWLVAYATSEEALRKAVYGEGLDLERATVARTIFERLVKGGGRRPYKLQSVDLPGLAFPIAAGRPRSTITSAKDGSTP